MMPHFHPLSTRDSSANPLLKQAQLAEFVQSNSCYFAKELLEPQVLPVAHTEFDPFLFWKLQS